MLKPIISQDPATGKKDAIIADPWFGRPLRRRAWRFSAVLHHRAACLPRRSSHGHSRLTLRNSATRPASPEHADTLDDADPRFGGRGAGGCRLRRGAHLYAALRRADGARAGVGHGYQAQGHDKGKDNTHENTPLKRTGSQHRLTVPPRFARWRLVDSCRERRPVATCVYRANPVCVAQGLAGRLYDYGLFAHGTTPVVPYFLVFQE